MIQYQNGKIIIEKKLHEEAVFHVSNECQSAIFNGKGALSGYALANEKDYIKQNYLILVHNGKPVDVYSNTRVEMIGRSQTVVVSLDGAELTIEQFLDAEINGVFTSYRFVGKSKTDSIEIGVSFLASSMENVQKVEPHTWSNGHFSFAANGETRYEYENQAVYFTVASGEALDTVLSWGLDSQKVAQCAIDFAVYRERMQVEIAAVHLPAGLDEMQKAMFYSSYFCSLQNYKKHGDYKAFMAGHHYLIPMRSYYRDTYFTVLPMYRGHKDKVRDQIITLANGISDNGDCPSAVKSDYTEWWENHFDSPSFLAMMLYDYAVYTNDLSILSEDVKGVSVFERTVLAIKKLSQFADETGLLYKEGPYNKRDWADEVNRTGYVTYNEILYARALFCLSKLYQKIGQAEKGKCYADRFETVKDAINKYLWDEELGYYVNFKDKTYTETNLSIDTCFAAIFGIADDGRARRMLERMEAVLETKNNAEQKAGDFGVMCVYPFYGRVDSAYRKSSQPYYYHNGANWPYLCAMYAHAKRKYGMEYRYALESWFDYNTQRGNYTPVEFFSPPQKDGSLLQAWCGAVAFVMDEALSLSFYEK